MVPLTPPATGKAHALALAILGMAAIVVATVVGWWALLPDIAPKRIVVAVLPFDDAASGTDDARWLGDGIAEDVRIALAQAPEFVVLDAAATFAYRDSPNRLARLRDELGATHAIQGRVRLAGVRLQVAARLTNLAERAPLWEEDWDAQLAELFAIRDAIARAIAQKLLLLGESAVTAGPPVALDAYEAFLRGRALGRAGDMTGAEELIRQSLHGDMHNPYAHAWLALRVADADTALGHAQTALRQAPGFPQAQALAAWLGLCRDGDAPQCFEALYQIVAQQRDALAMHWLAELYAAGGHPDDAALLRGHLGGLDPAGAVRDAPHLRLQTTPDSAALADVAWRPASELFVHTP